MTIFSSAAPIAAPLVSLAMIVFDFREGVLAWREGKPCREPFVKAAVHAAVVAMELVH